MKIIKTASYVESARHVFPSKKREMGQSPMGGNYDYYRSIYPEERPPIKDTDIIKVYHGFRDIEDAVAACRYGLSGRARVGRTYSYESDNNPYGLFVTTDVNVAKEFGSTIIEFNAKVSELEAPVWPSGGYTVQGGMAEYFSGDRVARENARKKSRQQAIEQGIPSAKESDRPELFKTLFMMGESQALFVGHLRPNRITGVYARKVSNESPYISYKKVSREEFLRENKSMKQPKGQGEAALSSRRLFSVDEEFDAEKFIQRLVDKYPKKSHDEMRTTFLRAFGRMSFATMKQELRSYVWPKQMAAAIKWIYSESKKNKNEQMDKLV